VTPFQSLRDYEEFIYTLQQGFPIIKNSSLVVIRRGQRVAILQGELVFAHGYRLVIKERLSYEIDTVVIETYGYVRGISYDMPVCKDISVFPYDHAGTYSFSTLTKTQYIAMGMSFGMLILLGIVGSIPGWERYTPAQLVSWASNFCPRKRLVYPEAYPANVQHTGAEPGSTLRR